MEQSFVMIKPDGVQRGLIAPILDRFLSKVLSRHVCLQVWQGAALHNRTGHKGPLCSV